MDTLKAILEFWMPYSLTARLTYFLIFAFIVAIILSAWMFIFPWIQNRETSTDVQGGKLEPVHKLVESDESVVIQEGARRVEVPLVDCGEPAAVSA
jgi:hypothetical protein